MVVLMEMGLCKSIRFFHLRCYSNASVIKKQSRPRTYGIFEEQWQDAQTKGSF